MNTFIRYLLKACNYAMSILFLILGTVVFLYGAYEAIMALIGILGNVKEGKIISELLKGVDLVFLGLVIQVLGLGLFELFVRPLRQMPDWLVFDDFDDLKLILVKASITVITISIVGKSVTWEGDESILHYGVGMGVVILALSYFIKVKAIDQ